MTGLYPYQQRVLEEVLNTLRIEARLYQMISAEYYARTRQNLSNHFVGCVSTGGYNYTSREAASSAKKAREALFQLIGNREPEDAEDYE